MELREITSIDELSDLVSASTFDEFYQKIVEENHRFEEEYYETFKNMRLSQQKSVKRFIYRNWTILGKIMKLWHLLHGIKHPSRYYQSRPFLWEFESYMDRAKYAPIREESSDARPFFDLAKDIYDNIEQYKLLYDLLEDEASKTVLMGLLVSRLTGDHRHITDLTSKNPTYFDSDIIKAYEDEVVVDAGGFIGDSTEALLKTPEAKGKVKKIYFYEPNQSNVEEAKENLSKFDVEIVFRKAGILDKRGSFFLTEGYVGGRITSHGEGLEKVDVIALDEDIAEKVTFIKMDIEGSEKEALQGCRRHILEDTPTLAISVYHKLNDVLWVPQYVKSLHAEYKLYLRHYDPNNAFDTVMYFLPR